jgi:predicted esterase
MATPLIVGKKGARGPVVLFFHGLGDTGSGIAPVGRAVADMCRAQQLTEEQTWIFPTAPHMPVTINGGLPCNSWYDITSLEHRDRSTLTGLSAACDSAAELAKTYRGDRPLFVGGFSQGGAVAIETVFSGRILGVSGCFGLSTYGIGEVSDTSDCPPFLMLHGEDDEVVQMQWARASFNRLQKKLGDKAVFKTLPDLGHSVDMRGIEEVARFIAAHKQ